LAHRLIAAGFEARLISSMALARTREALHNGWDKNDPKDAQVILHMLRIGATTVYSDPGYGRLNDLQELSKTHDMVSRAKTELWHRLLTHYLPLYFPEAERFQGNSRSDWFLALLEQFPTPAGITALSKEAFIEAAWGLVGRKVSKARLLADIYETTGQRRCHWTGSVWGHMDYKFMRSVFFTAADWNDDERRAAIAQILRLEGVPDVYDFSEPKLKPKRGKE
jgi:Transposase